jgi:hypothetical protein
MWWSAFARLRIHELIVENKRLRNEISEQALVESLKKVKAAGSFEVLLPWPKKLATSGELKDAGFMPTRPTESIGTGPMAQMGVAKD